jgi:hypothetical protein
MRLEIFSLKLFVDLVFKVVIGCGVRDSGEAGESGGSAQIASRDSGEVA